MQRALPVGTARHRWMIAYTSLLALAAVTCGPADDPYYLRGSAVVIAYPASPNDPWAGTSALQLVFLPMATWDENWELEGRLAERWEHSPDFRATTYHLRTDVKWHDGEPVTAHDIKFTLELLSHSEVLSLRPGFIESVTVHDDLTVTIRFSEYRGFFDTGIVYYPKHLLEHLNLKEINDWEFWTHPVGNGPYRFVSYVPQTMMEFEANPDYVRGEPRIERVVLKFVGEEAGVTELLSGNVDVISYTNPARIPKLANDPRFRVYYWLYVGVARAIYYQNNLALFQDGRVRRALTLAINRRELLQLLSLPEDLPLFDGIYTPRLFRRGELLDPLTYDPARARALLEAASWRDNNGDGVREREGKEARFTAIVADLPGFQEMAIYTQSQLSRVGIHMAIQVLESTLVHERVRSGEFEAAFAPFRHEPRWLKNRFGEDSPIGYRNAEVITLIGRAMMTAEPDEMDRIYRELMEIFRRDMPVTFLHPVVRTFFAHRRLRGLSTPFRADPLRFMEHLWLEDED